MYVTADGSVYGQPRQYYSIYEPMLVVADDYNDWEPEGLSREQLLARVKPVTDAEVEYGYLAPNGTFYGCEYHEHQWLAEAISHHLIPELRKPEGKYYSSMDYCHAEDDVQKHGWAVLKFPKSYGERWMWPEKSTQAQRDAAWDRNQSHDEPLPWEMKYDGEYS